MAAPAATGALIQHTRLAEALGFHRIWFPEHHVAGSTHPCPSFPVLLGGSSTTTIRVGTGCILAGYRRPIQIAELGRFLASNLPGRVDMALGLGPGVPEPVRQRFGWEEDASKQAAAYDKTLRESFELLGDHPGDDVAELLSTWAERPEPWLVGASKEAARRAASVGANFAVGWVPAATKNAAAVREVMDEYRMRSQDSGLVRGRGCLVIDVSEPFPGLQEIVISGSETPNPMVRTLGDRRRATRHLEDLAKMVGADELMITTGGLGGAVGRSLWRWLAPKKMQPLIEATA